MNKKLLPAYLLTFVNVLGISILMPVLPFIIEAYGAEKWVFGLMLTLYSGFQFIGSPYLGSMSDSIGRKPVLIISQIGTLISWFIFLLALFLPDTSIAWVSIPLLIIGFARALDGITGGNTSVANAYVSDITTRDEKSYIFGYLGGIAGIGMIVGPGIGGITSASPLGFKGTIIAAILISTLTLIAIFLWLKESHEVENRAEKKRESVFKSFLIFRRIREIQPKPIIKLLFLVKFFFSVMMAFYMGVMSLYLIDLFEFEPDELGMFMFVVGIFLSFNQAFLSPRIIKKLGEFPTLLLGLSLSIIGLIAVTLTSNFWLYISFYYIMNLGLSFCFPTFNALISIHADPNKQGAVMGISESINSLAMAVFLTIGSAIYALINYQVFYLMAALPLTALFIALYGFRRIQKKSGNNPTTA